MTSIHTTRATRPVASTAASRSGFGAADWALLAGVALAWGASFLLIKVGDEGLRPALVGVLRLAFGMITLAVMPAARRPVPRRAWPPIALLGFAGVVVICWPSLRHTPADAAGLGTQHNQRSSNPQGDRS
jgi:drug/metabolite transporter (DMT)-like permease